MELRKNFFEKISNWVLTFLYAHDIFNVRTGKEAKAMCPAPGRPPSDNPKNERLYIRVTAAEKQEIMDHCKTYNVTPLELVRIGMDTQKKE